MYCHDKLAFYPHSFLSLMNNMYSTTPFIGGRHVMKTIFLLLCCSYCHFNFYRGIPRVECTTIWMTEYAIVFTITLYGINSVPCVWNWPLVKAHEPTYQIWGLSIKEVNNCKWFHWKAYSFRITFSMISIEYLSLRTPNILHISWDFFKKNGNLYLYIWGRLFECQDASSDIKIVSVTC